MLKAYRIYIKKYISTLRLTYGKPTAFAICASRFDFRPCRFCALHAFLNQDLNNIKVKRGTIVHQHSIGAV
ncbi:hypothetical protein Hanom_Chr12g01111351 [Helianthus anomalus]